MASLFSTRTANYGEDNNKYINCNNDHRENGGGVYYTNDQAQTPKHEQTQRTSKESFRRRSLLQRFSNKRASGGMSYFHFHFSVHFVFYFIFAILFHFNSFLSNICTRNMASVVIAVMILQLLLYMVAVGAMFRCPRLCVKSIKKSLSPSSARANKKLKTSIQMPITP